MPLRKASQAVIVPNICTTDTNQTISGVKTFSSVITGNIIGNVTGNITGNVAGNVAGNVTGNVAGNVTGNAGGSASTLATPRTIAISGDITGMATSFNGGSDISIPTTIASGVTITSPAFAGTATGATGAKIPSSLVFGSIAGSSAQAGYVGEVISSSVLVANKITLTTGVTSAVTSINLTPGDWAITGLVAFRADTNNLTDITVLKQGAGTSATAFGSQDTFSTFCFGGFVPTSNVDVALPIPTQYIITTTSPSTTIFLLTQVTFTLAGLAAFGNIQARRIR